MSAGEEEVGVHSLRQEYHLLTFLYGYFRVRREVVVGVTMHQTPFLQIDKHVIYNASAGIALTIIGLTVGAVFRKESHSITFCVNSYINSHLKKERWNIAGIIPADHPLNHPPHKQIEPEHNLVLMLGKAPVSA